MQTGGITSEQTGAEIPYEELIERWSSLAAEELFEDIFSLLGRKAAIGTSFQKTGLVQIDIASRVSSNFRVFTIDTGRLFPETHAYMKQIAERYKIDLDVYRYDEQEVAKLLEQSPYRDYLFMENQRLRRLCCYTRKILPRNKALQTVDVWIAGIRKDQSDLRGSFKKVDTLTIEGRPLIKVFPLFDWTEKQLDNYIAEHKLPLHPLYTQGYKTIGCQLPCTTPSMEGELPRAGRWRWEQHSARECALHLSEHENGGGI